MEPQKTTSPSKDPLEGLHLVQFDDVGVLTVLSSGKESKVGTIFGVPHLDKYDPSKGTSYAITFEAYPGMGVWSPILAMEIVIDQLPPIRLGLPVETTDRWLGSMSSLDFLQLYHAPRPQKLTNAIATKKDAAFSRQELRTLNEQGTFVIQIKNHMDVIHKWLERGQYLGQLWFLEQRGGLNG